MSSDSTDLLYINYADGSWMSAGVTATAAVIIPGELVLSFAVKMPKLKGKALAQALPFACEDQLAQAVQNYHFATGAYSANQFPVVAMLQSDYNSLLTFLQTAQIKASGIFPDYLALPLHASKATVTLHDDRVLVRTGEYSGVSFAREHMQAIIPSLFTGEDDLEIIVYADPMFIAELQQALSGVEVKVREGIPDGELLSAANLPTDINLLARKDRVKEKTSPAKPAWIICIIVALIWLLTFIGVKLLVLHRYEAANASVQQQLQSVYQEIIPGQALPADVRGAIQPMLQQISGQGTDDFVTMMQKFGTIMQKFSDITITAISYSNKQLSLVMTDTNTGAFSALVATCNNRGLKVVAEQMTKQAKGVEMHMTLEVAK